METTNREGNEMTTKHTGTKYEHGTSTKDIAKAIRRDLAARFPKQDGWKFSVRCGGGTLHSTIDVTVKATPADLQIANPERIAYDLHQFDGVIPNLLTAEAAQVLATIEEIANDYNKFEHDSMTDYFNFRFYTDVRFDDTMRSESFERTRQQAEAALALGRAFRAA